MCKVHRVPLCLIRISFRAAPRLPSDFRGMADFHEIVTNCLIMIEWKSYNHFAKNDVSYHT